jgi:hypothetical protein
VGARHGMQWVLDTAYGHWRDVVLSRAQVMVALDYPRWVSLTWLLRRTARRLRNQESMCNGNVETWSQALSGTRSWCGTSGPSRASAGASGRGRPIRTACRWCTCADPKRRSGGFDRSPGGLHSSLRTAGARRRRPRAAPRSRE